MLDEMSVGKMKLEIEKEWREMGRERGRDRERRWIDHLLCPSLLQR